MNWDIQIGKYKLSMIERVVIERSVETLADTAEIILPATAYNQSLEIETKIQRGNRVIIKLGYDNVLRTEFMGYVEKIATDGGSITITCEDDLFNYRKDIPNVELQNATVNDIITYLHSSIFGYDVLCSYEFTYDTFVIQDATGYDVLKKIQEEAKPNIYIKGNTLHIHPQYIELFGNVIYDFAINVDRDGTALVYKDSNERKFMVVIEAKDAAGKTIKIEEGVTGGDKLSLNISGVSDVESLRTLAQETLSQKSYTGYEGTIASWLVPYCEPGYSAVIRDNEYEYKNGTYYILSVKTEFDKSGGKRTIELGKRL